MSADALLDDLLDEHDYEDCHFERGWSRETGAGGFAPNPYRPFLHECLAEHPLIAMTPSVLGGIPRIASARLSVGQVLGRLWALGSIQCVSDYYDQEISVDEIREAIAFAQDFLEIACDPFEAID